MFFTEWEMIQMIPGLQFCDEQLQDSFQIVTEIVFSSETFFTCATNKLRTFFFFAWGRDRRLIVPRLAKNSQSFSLSFWAPGLQHTPPQSAEKLVLTDFIVCEIMVCTAFLT